MIAARASSMRRLHNCGPITVWQGRSV